MYTAKRVYEGLEKQIKTPGNVFMGDKVAVDWDGERELSFLI